MTCPICKTNVSDGQRMCPGCGADMVAFLGVSADKIISNQTLLQHFEAGDDSVTQLIPENYMQSQGDDSVTQLIPENYMQSQGDDSVTQLIHDVHMQPQNTPYGQPAFIQQPYGQTMQPAFAQQSYGQPVQPYGQTAQPGYNGAGNFGNAKAPTPSRAISLATMLILLLTILTGLVFMTKPLFYVVEAYSGGVYDKEEIEKEIMRMDDAEDVAGAELGYRVIVGVALVFVVIAAINALVCFMRLNTGCIKSPMLQAVGTFILGFIGVGIIVVLYSMFDAEIESSVNFGAFSKSEASKFNCYRLMFVAGISSLGMALINIFTTSSGRRNLR